MLVAPRVSYPGVYIQEVPSDVRTIVGVDTATTAFIGRTKRGPVDDPVVIYNFGDFERIFGGLWLQSTLGYAVQSFFLNGGAKAVIVRAYEFGESLQAAAEVAAAVESVPIDDATPDGLKAKADEAAADFDKTKEPLKTMLAQIGEATSVAGVLHATRANTPRKHARLLVNPIHDAAQNVADAAMRAAEPADASKDDVVKATALAAKIYSDSEQEPFKTVAEMLHAAVEGAADIDAIRALDFPDLVQRTLAAQQVAAGINLEAVSEGGWSNKLRARVVEVSDIARSALKQQYEDVSEEDWFSLLIHDGETGLTEEIVNVTVVDSPRRLDKVLQSNSQLVRVAGTLTTESPIPHLNSTADDMWKDAFATSKVAVTGLATDADKLSNNAMIGSEAAKTGIFALEDADIFNLLCIPPFDGDDVKQMNPVHTDVWENAAKYCTDQRAMLIVDAPWDKKAEAVDGMPLIAPNANAAIYFPQVKMANRLRDNQVETFVACGAIAGIMARTDATRGVWKAPAGLDATLSGVVELDVPLTDDENGELNPLGVNCLR